MFGEGMDLAFGFVMLGILFINFFVLRIMAKKFISFSIRVFVALGLAVVEGLLFHIIFYSGYQDDLTMANNWLIFFGYGFVDLLKMIAIPIVFVSIFGAFTKMASGKSAGKIAGLVIGFLLGTAAIAAIVGIGVTQLFQLDAGEIIGVDISETTCDAFDGFDDYQSYVDSNPTEVLNEDVYNVCDYGSSRESYGNSKITTFPELLRSFVPVDAVYALTGKASNSTLKVVIFAALLGLAYLGIKKKKPENVEVLDKGFTALHSLIMRLTTIVLRLTPYGIFALMFRVFAFTGWESVIPLGKFLGASYVAIIAMFLIHAGLLALNGMNPLKYYAKGARTLLFAFTSRSSAATVPLTIETQENAFGVKPAVASTAASFGTSIGQNGCAGIYPAMLVTMVYLTGVIDVSFFDYVMLVFIVTLTSLGIAGIGGGATLAAIATFSALGLDDWMWLTGLLVGIEGLIDMARTSLNVSGSMLSGVLTGKYTGNIDMEIYNKKLAEIEPTADSDLDL